jgi:hypothetical protein
MSPGNSIRVKLSSEAAGAVAITQVVVRQMTLAELVGEILVVAGKDEERVRNLLLRGTLVSGGSRFRWDGWEADPQMIRRCLESFPDPDPSRLFQASACTRAVIQGPMRAIEVTRETGSEKSFLRRRTFWDALMEIAAGANLRYVGYSYRLRSDFYGFEPDLMQSAALLEAYSLLKYPTLRDQLHTMPVRSVQLYTSRTGSGLS